MKKYVIALSLVLASNISAASANEFIEVTSNSVNIRISAAADSEPVGQASKGMVFSLVEEKENWFEIVLPSGEYRYLHSSLAIVVDEAPELPESQAVLMDACQEILSTERQADEESTALEPDFMKQIDLSRLLVDKYKLTIFDKYGIPPARKSSLNVWCATH